MGNMANLLGRIFTHLPSAAQNEDTVLVTDPPGNAMATSRKRRHRRESEASDEDVDRLSVSADSDEDLDSLLGREISGKQSESQKADGSEDDALSNELEASIQDDDKKGPKINDKLATIAKKRRGRKLAQDKLASLLDKHPQPENCAEMVVPRTNPEIWAQLNSYKRKSDLKLANMQQTFAVLTLCDKVLALKGEAPSSKEMLSDGVNATVIMLLWHLGAQARQNNITLILTAGKNIVPITLLIHSMLASKVGLNFLQICLTKALVTVQ